MRTIFRVFLLCLMISNEGLSQDTFWQVRLFSFFDNNEFGHSEVQIPQTMAGVRLAPEIGVKYDSVHSIVFGVNLLHEYGSNKVIGNIYPTAYYQFNRKPFKFLMGTFPGNYAIKRYPRVFYQDSIAYYHPNINGILFEYSRESVFVNLWLDWTSRQSPEMREAFFLGYSSKYIAGIFYAQQFTYMFHFAGKMNSLVEEALHDNVILLTSIGLDLSGKTFFDKLDFNGGWIVGLDRARSDNTGWIDQHGFLSELRIEFKRVGLFNSFYSGCRQMHYYYDHANELYWGDPFYKAKKYNRTDLYIDFIKNKAVDTRLIYSLHFSENTMYHEQALKVSVNLNNL